MLHVRHALKYNSLTSVLLRYAAPPNQKTERRVGYDSLQAPKTKMADEVYPSNYISRSVSTIGEGFELLFYTVQRLL